LRRFRSNLLLPSTSSRIGFAQGFLNTPDGKKALDLPAQWGPVAPIIVGHPKGRPAPVPRKEPEIRWAD
jgi:hypothetical protein